MMLLCSERPKKVDAVKNKDGKLLTKEEEIRTRMKEHSSEVLNRPDSIETAEIQIEDNNELDIETCPPTVDEIRKAHTETVW